MIKALKLLLLPLAAFVALMVACNKSSDVTVDEAVDTALYNVQERGGLGKYGCYELVFPVTLVLPDSSTVEVNSYDEMKTALHNYFEANGGGQGGGHHHGKDGVRPSFVYPISVVSQDGEVITVNSDDELKALRAECEGTFGHHGPGGHGQHGLTCFEIVFPVTIQFPDSTTAQANSQKEIRDLAHQWRKANPGVKGKPKLVFPITVQMTADSTLVTVNSKAELHQLKKDCN